MSMIVDEKKRHFWTNVFVGALVVFSMACFGLMNTNYDALSRYPYTDRNSRELIKQYLNKQEIDYIIEYSIAPNMFVAYIREDGFSIYHAAEYKTLSRYQWQEKASDIVRMIEETRELIDADTLGQYLQYYSYETVYNHLIQGDLYNEGSELIMGPDSFEAWLDETHTVSDREPDHLVQMKGIVHTLDDRPVMVSETLAEPIRIMCADIEYDLGNGLSCGGLKLSEGYISYEESRQKYNDALQKYGQNVTEYVPYPGHDEHQLGYAVDFAVDGILDENFELTEQYFWLLWNSWHYGFTMDRTEKDAAYTGMKPQLWHFRYVGEETARYLHDNERSLGSYVNRNE